METIGAKSRIYISRTTASTDERTLAMALTVFYSVGIIIGIWSLAALFGGLVIAEGPLGLIKGYFQAVTGL